MSINFSLTFFNHKLSRKNIIDNWKQKIKDTFKKRTNYILFTL